MKTEMICLKEVFESTRFELARYELARFDYSTAENSMNSAATI